MKYLILLSLFSLISCGGSSGGGSSESVPEDSNSYAVEAAMVSMNATMNDAEVEENYAYQKPFNPIELLISSAYAYSCGFDRFTPSVGPSSTCAGTEDDATVTENFDGCNAGNSSRVYRKGQVKLDFDAPATCDEWVQGGALPTSGTLRVTTTNYASYLGANEFKITTENRDNYLDQNLGGGVLVTYGAASRTIDIDGIHYLGNRVLRKKTVNFLDYTVSTPVALTVSGTKRTNDRQITSGTIKIDNNKKEYTLTASASGLGWTDGCCYPTSGSLNFTRTGSITSNLQVNFSATCGEANFIEGSDNKVLSLSSCE